MRLAFAIALAGLMSACGQARAPGPDMAVILADAPAAQLSAYGLFDDMVSASPALRVEPYDLVNPLFSDHAAKDRFVFVPSGEVADYHDTEVFSFPVGTVLVKTFRFAPDMRAPDEGAYRVETRLLIHKADGWAAYPYVWNEAQTEATYAPVGARRSIETISPAGATLSVAYSVPNQNQCKTCHQSGRDIQPIGLKARHLNYDGQLDVLSEKGVIGPLPVHLPTEPAAFDVSLPLEARARAWLDINCAHCHKADGSASNSGLILSALETDPVKVGIGKRPVAAGRGAGNLLQIVVPGDPDRSILAFRLASVEPGVAMPELGRSVPDPDGLALVREWIARDGDGGVSGVRILVDADACPVKDEIYKVALRLGVPVVIVANSYIRIPEHPLISRKIVSDGFDAADDWIAEEAGPASLVVTADIPLADRALKAGAKVLAPNGKPFTPDSIGGALATRAIMADLRVGVAGIGAGGPAPFSKADRSRFLSALDTALVAIKRAQN